MVTIQFIPYSEIESLSSVGRIRKLLNIAKEDKIVWRGEANQPHRKAFLEEFWDHPLCDVGQTNKLKKNVPWQKSFMSIRDQLRYKFRRNACDAIWR